MIFHNYSVKIFAIRKLYCIHFGVFGYQRKVIYKKCTQIVFIEGARITEYKYI